MMTEIKLDERLQNDCHVLGRIGRSAVLLHRNAGIAWFILVPETDCVELVDLPSDQQARLLDNINRLSQLLREHFDVDKLNVAAIGNIVSQLHVHVIGRNHHDYCWPDPVWGTSCGDVYSDDEVVRVQQLLIATIEEFVAA